MLDIKALFEQDNRVKNVVSKLSQQKNLELPLSNTSFDTIFIANTIDILRGNHFIILNDKESAVNFYNDFKIVNPSIPFGFLEASFEIKSKLLYFPRYKASQRLMTVESLLNHEHKTVITYPEALIETISLKEKIRKKYAKGAQINLTEFIDFCDSIGFERGAYVYEYGQYAIRGNIIDVYSYAGEMPYRIELFDDEIVEIRSFDIETQLSIKDFEHIFISPNPLKTVSSGANETTEYWHSLPPNTYFWSIPPAQLLKKIKEEIHVYQDKELHPDSFDIEKPKTIDTTKFNTALQQYHSIHFSKTVEEESYISGIESAPLIYKNFNKLHQIIEQYQSEQYRIALMSEDEKQFERYRLIFKDLGKELDFIPIIGEFDAGFIDHNSKILFLTTHEIFSRNKHVESNRKSNVSAQAILLKSIKELKPGDFVTHIDHGVGRFSGLEKLESNGHYQEAVRLIYANNDILYVHINSLYKISKFVGKDHNEPKLNKLGSDTWQNLKRKTKKKIKDIAEDLIKLYAKRKATKGFAFSPDSYLQYELESSFQYEDTPDQTTATQDVKSDMEKEIPMDRLVCGDVGFGKTEVAIRASFKAVADSKQVAVLVPTTILAFQHYRTFKERLEDLPCTVEFINRFKTSKQKTEILKKLEEGKIDILIGTHALVGKNVKFKDLGLLVIDEEQKFGVGVKEKLKEMKLNVDTLTLTATPIPRTLQFSLLGARDYSLIQTPPPNRSPVYTECIQFDLEFIKEIIENEILRGGQVFFVHNRVKDLDQLYLMLKKVLPKINIAKAHGQLDGDTLEEILVDFVDQKYDVLLSTNIIESGIDIPNANTIIINNAHHFGMSDLHQLRGRVGRGKRKAYCYLVSPAKSTLTNESKQRLNAIEQNSELGSGFQIAMRDLDLRGAGNLLGGEQSGFISDIGYDTFMKILDETIMELKENDYKDLYEIKEEDKEYTRDCQIESDYDMYIPDEYIVGSQERMSCYTDLNNVKNEQELQVFLKNLKDIYGDIPTPLHEIANAIRLKWTATKLGIERIILKKGKMKCYLIQNQDSSYYQSPLFGNLLNYVSQFPVGTNMKQTPQHIIIEFQPFHNCKEAKDKLDHIMLSVHKVDPSDFKKS